MDQKTFRQMKFLFEPVESVDKLDEWCQYWLQVQFPWDTVDPDSTSSPLKALWGVYEYMLTGKGPSTHIIAASRNSMKTLLSAGIHSFSLLQLRRDDAHIAATLNQSSAATRYLGQFFDKIGSKIDINPYIKVNNFRTFELHNLPATDYATKSSVRAKIVTATLKGANSDRASCFPGKTKISLWPIDKELNLNKHNYQPATGRLNQCTMDGLWQRMQRGEELYTLSVNPKTTQIERKKIQAIQRYVELDRIIIETESGKWVETTSTHPFATAWDGTDFVYTQASDLSIGGQVILNRASIIGKNDVFQEFQSNIKTDSIKSIAHRKAHGTKRERWVYDVQVADHHNFFANSFLVHNCIILDEVDLTPEAITNEIIWVSDPSIPRGDDFQIPCGFIYLSSRKTNSGPIQKLMDRAAKNPTDDKLHKWSSSDFMRVCPPSVHLPDKPRVMAYVNVSTLETIWEEGNFNKSVGQAEQSQWKPINAYEGCRACPVWVPCLSNSVKQRGDSPSLRTREFVYGTHRNVSDPSYIIAQSLNWAPESKGLIYQHFSRFKHVKAPLEFFEWAVGTRYCPENMTPAEYEKTVHDANNSVMYLNLMPSKEVTYWAMRKAGWEFNIGIDWGSADPAAAHVMGWHPKLKRATTLHYENTPMANHLWAQYVEENIATVFPPELMCPDGADASSASYFKKHSSFTEKLHIEPGVSFMRGLLWNPIQSRSNYAIYDDSLSYDQSFESESRGNMIVVTAMEHWSHKRNAVGDIDLSKFNDDDWCHPLDSQRYALAPYIKDQRIQLSSSQSKNPSSAIHPQMSEADKTAIREQNQMKNNLQQHFMKEYGVDPTVIPENKKHKKQGTIKFKF